MRMERAQSVNADGNSLQRAVYLCRLRLTRLLLEGGAYINESNERGETPLMVACRTKYSDNQSVSQAKMVKYLLDSGADPNIQDMSGKTALMHACLNLAGPEVVSLLLDSGADPCLDDQTGTSAIVNAINTGNEEALKLLIDACKAKGKEVIIITPDKLACGGKMTKEYLKVPPLASLEQWDRLHSSLSPCASPSEVQLHTSSEGSLWPNPSEPIFSFQGHRLNTNSQPTLLSHQLPLVRGRVEKLQQLQRLHSEPWLKIPPSFLAQQLAECAPPRDLVDPAPEEGAFGMNRLPFVNTPLTRHCSIDLKDAQSGFNHTSKRETNADDHGGLRPEGALGRKMSFDGLSSLHSHSHPNLHSKSSTDATTMNKHQDKSLPNLAVSSLRNIIQRRNLGVDHYNSDSQLSVPAGHCSEDHKSQLERRRLPTSRSSTLIGSHEVLEHTSLAGIQKRHSVSLERRGSGALLSDHISQPRPGFLPPLNQHPPIPSIVGAGGTESTNPCSKPICSAVTGIKPCVPSAPAGYPKDLRFRRLLLRRHSMQTEQIKQLGEFKDVCGQ